MIRKLKSGQYRIYSSGLYQLFKSDQAPCAILPFHEGRPILMLVQPQHNEFIIIQYDAAIIFLDGQRIPEGHRLPLLSPDMQIPEHPLIAKLHVVGSKGIGVSIIFS